MPLDFPSSPSIGDTIPLGAKKYQWTGEQWAAANVTSLNVEDSPTVDLTWNSSTNTLSADILGIGNVSGSGWQKLPGGLIVQWGNVIDDGAVYSFPVTFPNQCVVMVAATENNTWESAYDTSVQIRSTSTYSVRVGATQNNASQTAYWIALGY